MVCTQRHELRRKGGREMVRDGSPNPEVGVAPRAQDRDRRMSLVSLSLPSGEPSSLSPAAGAFALAT